MSKINARKIIERDVAEVKKDPVVTPARIGKGLKRSKKKEGLNWACDYRFRLTKTECASCGELVEPTKAKYHNKKINLVVRMSDHKRTTTKE